ncbi:MAG: GNAT family N-acetyltransferase [Nocardioidaceae bacterium]
MALHRDLVGSRVVVRSLIPGETGPSGGPAMTDVLGVMVSWTADELTVCRANGDVVTLRQADIVTAKPVPPRPSVRHRVTPAQLQRICSAGWRPVVEESLGEWLLRAAGGFTCRANSVLMVGDPGLGIDEALAHVSEFYARQNLPVLVQVVAATSAGSGGGSRDQHSAGVDWAQELTGRGWLPARPGQPDVLVQITSVAKARRLRGAHSASTIPDDKVEIGGQLERDWLALYDRASGHNPETVETVLTSGDQVAFVRGGDPAFAIGRGVLIGDWLGVAAVEVAPSHRRQGWGRAIVDALLEWGASQGALSAYLQILPDNEAARALYAPYGFETHSTYRYLGLPELGLPELGLPELGLPEIGR